MEAMYNSGKKRLQKLRHFFMNKSGHIRTKKEEDIDT